MTLALPEHATLDYAKPLQEAGELAELVALLASEGVRSYLEVGARYGGSFETVMRSLPAGSYGMAIDLPGAAFGDKASEPILRAAAQRLRDVGYDIDVVIGACQHADTVSAAAARCPFDAVLIDADHSYAAVKRDFAVYAMMARVVILHDVAAPAHVRSSTGLPVEVPRFWNEIKHRHRHQELVASHSLMGIGIIWPGVPN